MGAGGFGGIVAVTSCFVTVCTVIVVALAGFKFIFVFQFLESEYDPFPFDSSDFRFCFCFDFSDFGSFEALSFSGLGVFCSFTSGFFGARILIISNRTPVDKIFKFMRC